MVYKLKSDKQSSLSEKFENEAFIKEISTKTSEQLLRLG